MRWACPCPCAGKRQPREEPARLRATRLGGCWARSRAALRLRPLRLASRLRQCLQARPSLDPCTVLLKGYETNAAVFRFCKAQHGIFVGISPALGW